MPDYSVDLWFEFLYHKTMDGTEFGTHPLGERSILPEGPPQSQTAIRVISLLDPSGRKNREGFKPEEIETARKIKEAFLNADQYAIRIGGGGLGDRILQSAYVNGICNAVKHLRGRHKPITLYVEPELMGIYKDYERIGIRVIPLELDKNDALFSFHQSVNTINGNIFALDMLGQGFDKFDVYPHFMQYPTNTIGRNNQTNTATVISNVWNPVILNDYAKSFGERKFAAHLGQIIGFDAHTLNQEDVQPNVPLPKGERKRYKSILAPQFNIDTEAIQIAGIFQTAQADKAYSIEHWRKVLEQVREALKTIKPNRSINFNIIIGPTWNKLITELMGEKTIKDGLNQLFANDPRIRINFISTNLADLTIILRHQDLVLADDTGPAHIAAHIDGGPHVVGAFLPHKFILQTWASGPRHHGVTLTESEFTQFTEDQVRLWETVGNPVVINTIPPERVSEEGIKYLLPRLRKHRSVRNKLKKLFK